MRRDSVPEDPERLVKLCGRKPTSMVWPGPVHEHLDHLVRVAISDGENDALSRAELAAALIWSAPTDAKRLSALLKKYRKAKAGDRLPNDGNVVHIHSHSPGRRRPDAR